MPALGMYPPLSCLLHCTSVVKVAHLISSGLQKGNSNPRGGQEFASLELQLFVLILTSLQGFLGSGYPVVLLKPVPQAGLEPDLPRRKAPCHLPQVRLLQASRLRGDFCIIKRFSMAAHFSGTGLLCPVACVVATVVVKCMLIYLKNISSFTLAHSPNRSFSGNVFTFSLWPVESSIGN